MTEKFERLFFALWPDPAVRGKISAAYRGLSGISSHAKPLRVENLHMTLHFLGNIPLRQVDCFVRQAEQVRTGPFSLTLSRVGYFNKARVLWIGCQHVPAQLTGLHEQLGSRLRACGFQPDSRPYNPHVTLARKVRGAEESNPIEPIVWSVDRFVLVKSVAVDNGVQYQVRNSYPLNAAR